MVLERRADGVVYARSPHPLGPYPDRLTDTLGAWAARAGERTFLAERGPDGEWLRLTYRDALERTRRIARALVARPLSVERPIAILSGHGIEHAVLALGAMHCGVPYAPLAPAYSLLSRDFSALRFLLDRLRPGLVFAAEGRAFEPALALAAAAGAEIVTCTPPVSLPATRFEDLESGPGDSSAASLEDAHARVGPDTIAKILFTSGSTGHPKGVINTQRMLCANQEQLRTVMAFLGEAPPVLCDWLPWNHTFGGNHNFGIALYNGGTLYLDRGRPVPGQFDETVRNLREIAPTAYFNVPKGFEMLLPVLCRDQAFRKHFFSRLQILFYAAAGLRQEVADAFVELSIETLGERLPWVTGLGATESAPFAICTGAQMSMTTKIGVPAPGVELKVAPVGDRLEARLRGPNITPGYWRDEALTAAAFDEEGYYRMGDAVAFADPDRPLDGFVFQGRIAEDFKLSTGTWVWVGPLRAKLLAALGDLAQDVVLTAPDRDFVGALIFPNLRGWRERAAAHSGSGTEARAVAAPNGPRTRSDDVPTSELLRTPAVVDDLRRRLQGFAAENPGSSTTIRRALVLEEPPSLDGREITDKGSINQRAVLSRRAALVELLYRPSVSAGVVAVTPEAQDA
jgi:feruloyl-CoA synthase